MLFFTLQMNAMTMMTMMIAMTSMINRMPPTTPPMMILTSGDTVLVVLLGFVGVSPTVKEWENSIIDEVAT
jgi:hypothetical protein